MKTARRRARPAGAGGGGHMGRAWARPPGKQPRLRQRRRPSVPQAGVGPRSGGGPGRRAPHAGPRATRESAHRTAPHPHAAHQRGQWTLDSRRRRSPTWGEGFPERPVKPARPLVHLCRTKVNRLLHVRVRSQGRTRPRTGGPLARALRQAGPHATNASAPARSRSTWAAPSRVH